MVGLRLPIRSNKSVSLDDMQRAIEQTAAEEHERVTCECGDDGTHNPSCAFAKVYRLAGHIYPEPAPVYTFAQRLSAAAKRTSTNWRMNQEAVDHSWERQDAIRVGVKSRFRAEVARRWVDESLRRAREVHDG